MAVINVSAGDEAYVELAPEGQIGVAANVLAVPQIQDVTINNSTGVFRFKILSSGDEQVVTTPATNQVTLNLVVDKDTFFGNAGLSANGAVVEKGLFGVSNDKTKVDFKVYFDGTDSNSKWLSGAGFISGLSPTVSADSPVWTSSCVLEVDGSLTEGEV